MTFDDFIRIGEIQSKMETYQRRKQKAIETCVNVLKEYQNPYVALSGGKDSAAMCFLVDEAARQCGRDFRLWSHISDASFPGTLETCREIAEKLNRPLDIYNSPVSAFDNLSQPAKQAFGKRGVYFDSVREYSRDKDLCFVGVRATESKRRHKSAMVHGQIFYSKDMGDITVCHPLLWFRLEDVAAAIYEYHVPVHPIYYKATLESRDNALHEDMFIRLGYITSKDLLNKGTALFLKVNYPEQYNRLCEAWPEIRMWV